jgi:hypothetical protein
LRDEPDRVARAWFRKANPGQPEPAIVYQGVTDGLKEILLVDRLSERAATIDDHGLRQPIGAFGVQTVLLLGLSVHGFAEQVRTRSLLLRLLS